MADEPKDPADAGAAVPPVKATPGAEAASSASPAKASPGAEAAPTASPAKAAADKPASDAPGEPLKAEVSRTDSPGAGASAAPPAAPTAPTPAAVPQDAEA